MTDERNDIVVCGYPKSGTTWLSRLVAELVGCPFHGDLGYADGRPLEGRGRESEFDCYKSHRTLSALATRGIHPCQKLIYIVRDPRDVAISAAHHFRVSLFATLRSGNRVMTAVNSRLGRVVPYAVKRNRMVRAVLYGDPSLSLWLGVPWRDHYGEFRRSGILILKYEDLLDDPRAKCVELLAYLGISRSEERIAEAIANQSFEKKKALFASRGMTTESAFLRRGRHGYWRTELGSKQKQLFLDEICDELRALSYSLD